MRGTLVTIVVLTGVVIASLAGDAAACHRRRGGCHAPPPCYTPCYSDCYVAPGAPYTPGTPNYPGASNVVGTWNGDEDLKGYDKLTFQLRPDGTATMIDAKGTFQGYWSGGGNQVTIDFPGTATYNGTISGNMMSGNGNDAPQGMPRSWNFKVTKQ